MNWRRLLQVAVVLAALWLGWLLRAVTAPLFAAYLLMLVLLPLHRRFRKRLGASASAVTCVLVLLVVPIVLALPAALDFRDLAAWLPLGEFQSLQQQLDAQILELWERLPENLRAQVGTGEGAEEGDPRPPSSEDLLAHVQDWLAGSGEAVVRFFGGVFGILSGALLLPIFLFFLLHGAPWLPRIRHELPPDWQPRFDRVMPRIEEILRLYLVSRTAVAATKGLIALVILWLLGFPGAYSLAFVLGAFSLLPVLGPLLAFLVLGLVAFADGGRTGGGLPGLVVALLLYGGLEVLEGYVLMPRMVGRGLGMSDFAVILAVLAGGALMGIFGLVIAVPAVAVAAVLYDEFVRPLMGTPRKGESEEGPLPGD